VQTVPVPQGCGASSHDRGYWDAWSLTGVGTAMNGNCHVGEAILNISLPRKSEKREDEDPVLDTRGRVCQSPHSY